MSDAIEIEAGHLHLTIEGASGVVEAGRSATIALTLFNAGDTVDEVRFQVEGIDPAWTRFAPAAVIAVFPGEPARAGLTIEVPEAAPPGCFTYTVCAQSREVPGDVLRQMLPFCVTSAPVPPLASRPAAPRAEPPGGEALGAKAVVPDTGTPAPEPAPPKLIMPHSVMPLPGSAPAESQAPARAAPSAPASPVPPPRSRDALLQSTKIGLQFDRTQLVLSPGETAIATITVTNKSSIVDTVQLEVYGLDLGWMSVSPGTVTLQPGEVGQALLAVNPPPPALAGAITFFVRARSWVEAAEITEAALMLEVRAQVRFSLQLEPPQASGEREAAYELRILNEGNAPLALGLAGKDDARRCTYVFAPAVPAVAPQSEGRVRVTVQAAVPLPGNQPQPVFFTVVVTPQGQAAPAQQIAGQFVHLPSAPVALELSPQSFTDARQGTYTLRVNSASAADVALSLSGADAGNACLFILDPALIRVPAGQAAEVRLTVRARELNATNAAREVQFTITASQVGGGAAPVSAAGRFVQAANPNPVLNLNPPEASAAGAAQYVLTVQNPKAVPVTVTLQALDATGACACAFSPATLALAPGTQGQALLQVAPKDRMPPGEQRRVHAFTVTAAASTGERTQIEGRLAQVPEAVLSAPPAGKARREAPRAGGSAPPATRRLGRVVLGLVLLCVAAVAGVAVIRYLLWPPPPPDGGLAVGIVLPTRDEPRWLQDEARFRDALAAAGYRSEILFSQGDTRSERANVAALIDKGIQVLIICPQDSSAAAGAAEAARAAGVKVISYDRLIRDTAAVDYYVTFDSAGVGMLQARYLVDHATGAGNNLYLYAGAASDNNAFIFFEGAWGVLQPRIADGTFVVRNSDMAMKLSGTGVLTRDEEAQIIAEIQTDWNFDMARKLADVNLMAAGAAGKGTVFILAPNDGTARAIADVFAADKDVWKYYITGQDAEKESVQYIIDGKQSMTVFKDVRMLANDAVAAAVALLQGKAPAAKGSYDNGRIDVPLIESRVSIVDRDNVRPMLIDSGYYPAGDFTGLP